MLKKKPQLGRKYVQAIYLENNLYLKYVKNSQHSVVKQTIHLEYKYEIVRDTSLNGV